MSEVTANLTNMVMSAQRQRGAKRMAGRRQRLALGPVCDHQAEIAEAIPAVPLPERAGGDPAPKQKETVMSAQRQRRARRMAVRRERLALGPSSEHEAEIAMAIALVYGNSTMPSETEGTQTEVEPTPEATSVETQVANCTRISTSSYPPHHHRTHMDLKEASERLEDDDATPFVPIDAAQTCDARAVEQAPLSETAAMATTLQIRSDRDASLTLQEAGQTAAVEDPIDLLHGDGYVASDTHGRLSTEIASSAGDPVEDPIEVPPEDGHVASDTHGRLSTEIASSARDPNHNATESVVAKADHNELDVEVETGLQINFQEQQAASTTWNASHVPTLNGTSSLDESSHDEINHQIHLVTMTTDERPEQPTSSESTLISELAELFPDLKSVVTDCQSDGRNPSEGTVEATAVPQTESLKGSISSPCLERQFQSPIASPKLSSENHPAKQVDQSVIELLQPRIRCQSLSIKDLVTFDLGSKVKNINSLFEIGRGSYGRVRLARHAPTNTLLAIKQPTRSNNHASPGEMVDEWKTTRTRAMKEGLIHQLLSDSPFFPKFWGTMESGDDLCLALQFVGDQRSGVSFPLNDPPQALSAADVIDIAEDIVRGMAELHDHGFLHNDLKTDNVLLEFREKRFRAVITDFGMTSAVGTPLRMTGLPGEIKTAYIRGEEADYLAPEIVLYEEHTSVASDVFSLGRLLLDITPMATYSRCLSIRKLSDLGIECLKRDPTARPSLEDILNQVISIKSTIKRPPIWKRLLKKFH